MVRWGLIGAGDIVRKRVAAALRDAPGSELAAVSRARGDLLEPFAASVGAGRWYTDWRDLVADDRVDAVYIATPVHLHANQTIAAAEAGKHVLCEKPIALSVTQCRELMAVRDRTGVKIGEAFMVRSHPQWLRAREIARSGDIGELRAVMGVFSYFNRDPKNIRNVTEYGGGALMDIGCYLIHTARMVFGREPARVSGAIERDPRTGIDRITALGLDFAPGQAVGLCATQMVPSQRVQIFGTRGRLEVEIPFNAPPDRPCRLFIDDGSRLGEAPRTIELPVANQYTLQGDLFSLAVRKKGQAAYPLEDSVRNMRVLDAIVRAASSGRWESL